MPELQPEFPDQPGQDYNYDGDSGTTNRELLDEIRVIVPPDPPEFGPAAARALLRLLIALHRKRADAAHDRTEET